MKNAILFLVLTLLMINVSCGSSGSSNSSSSGSTKVSIRLGQSGASANSIAGAVNSSAVPSGVTTIRVTVSASDMATIVKEVSVVGESSVTVTIDIPNGPNRLILVEALDASGNVLYSGQSVVSLGGEPLQVTIVMVSVCSLYVDTAGADESDCTDSSNPCRTITHAISQADNNMIICVAEGRYDIGGGEDFPLTLLPGMTLRCDGENHTTEIDGRDTDGFDTIYGAAGAMIKGCYIYADVDATAIDDNGSVITVDDCILNGVGGAYTGITFAGDSTARNSTIINFEGVEGGGNGIYLTGESPVISGNTLQNNYRGIYIISGSPTISGNTIGGMNGGGAFGIFVSTGTADISGNTITYNSTGINIQGGGPIINNNTLSCNSGVDLYYEDDGDIDARNNSWDMPLDVAFDLSSCDFYHDICSNGGEINYSGAMEAPACISSPE